MSDSSLLLRDLRTFAFNPALKWSFVPIASILYAHPRTADHRRVAERAEITEPGEQGWPVCALSGSAVKLGWRMSSILHTLMFSAVAMLPCVICFAWLAWAFAAARLMRGPREHDPLAALFLAGARVYVRCVHRLRVVGREHIPPARSASGSRVPVGPLIVVCNHTAGVDPVLVQSACDFEIRWMMAEDMMTPALKPLWDWAGLISVDRTNPRGDPGALREALAHLAAGGVVGIFPEGAIARAAPPHPAAPPLLPFAPGVGLLIHKSGAPVLQAVITGTPRTPTAFGSLIHPSRSRVRFLEPIDFAQGPHAQMKAGAIAESLRERALSAISAIGGAPGA